MLLAALDVGGHNIRCLLADRKGEPIARRSAATVRDATSPQQNLDAVCNLIADLTAESGHALSELGCVSLGVPGVVDPSVGRVVLVPNVPGWDGLELGRELKQRFGVPVRVDNDVNLAARGEFWKGAAQSCPHFFFMAIGTGIGGGVFVNGEPYSGSHFAAGEIGYFVLAPGQKHRRVGELGWFESVASGWALDQAGSELARWSPSSPLRELVPSGEVKSHHVFAAAGRGDQQAQALLDEAFEFIALAVVNITALLDPETIVFGGGMSSQGERLLDPVRSLAGDYGIPIPSLRLSRLGEEAPVMGALHAALRVVEERG